MGIEPLLEYYCYRVIIAYGLGVVVQIDEKNE
jgi:hypothetical protein